MMKTIDVKVNSEYIYNGNVVTVIEKIKGDFTKKRNMQSGILFTGYCRQQKKFLLSTGDIVKANKLITKS